MTRSHHYVEDRNQHNLPRLPAQPVLSMANSLSQRPRFRCARTEWQADIFTVIPDNRTLTR